MTKRIVAIANNGVIKIEHAGETLEIQVIDAVGMDVLNLLHSQQSSTAPKSTNDLKTQSASPVVHAAIDSSNKPKSDTTGATPTPPITVPVDPDPLIVSVAPVDPDPLIYSIVERVKQQFDNPLQVNPQALVLDMRNARTGDLFALTRELARKGLDVPIVADFSGKLTR